MFGDNLFISRLSAVCRWQQCAVGVEGRRQFVRLLFVCLLARCCFAFDGNINLFARVVLLFVSGSWHYCAASGSSRVVTPSGKRMEKRGIGNAFPKFINKTRDCKCMCHNRLFIQRPLHIFVTRNYEYSARGPTRTTSDHSKYVVSAPSQMESECPESRSILLPLNHSFTQSLSA